MNFLITITIELQLNPKKKLIIGIFLCLLIGATSAHAANIRWQRLVTKYTIIHYQSQGDLKKFNKKVAYSKGGFGSLFGSSGGKGFQDKLKKKIDSLFQRAQEILDMKKYVRKVRINIYSNKGQLKAAFRVTFKGSSKHRAWYLFEKHTIFVQVNDLNEGILAHEMAHAIIDNYLKVRPPSASAEILARYVDAHLYD